MIQKKILPGGLLVCIALLFSFIVVKAFEANHYAEAGLVGQCTWYTAEIRPDLRFNRGGASTWVSVSRSKGYQVDDTPEVEAIAVWQPGVAKVSSTWGHVAYVISVADDTHFTVRECNCPVGTCYRTRDVIWESGIEFVHTEGYQTDSSQGATQPSINDPQVTYTYMFSPFQAYLGDSVRIDVGAADIAGYRHVQSVEILIDGKSIGVVKGSSGHIDWNTSGSSPGTHMVKFQVVLTDWSGSVSVTEKNYTLQPKQESQNQKPYKPSAASPSDWAVLKQDEVKLCGQENGDPNSGDSVQHYFFEIFDSAQNWQSGWVNSKCVTTSSLGMYNYQWHVKVRDQKESESDWSDTRHFTIESSASATQAATSTVAATIVPGPNVPILREPASGGVLNTSDVIWFSWYTSDGATEYYLEYWGGPLSTLNSGWIKDSAYYIGTMWPGTYSWHVRARNSSGESAWSPTWNFTIPEKVISTATDIPIPTSTPLLQFTGNVAPRSSRSPDGSNSGNAFDDDTNTFWVEGLGHQFSLMLSWGDNLPVTRIIVWARPQNSPDNNQINVLQVTLSNGVSKTFDMDSGGRRCIDINLSSPQAINSVNMFADDASGNNGIGEVEIWVGSKTGGPGCSNMVTMP